MSDPMKVQVDGGHYKSMVIQPMEFSMANCWDAAAHTALKYISRFRDKAGRKDLEKARHCIEMHGVLAKPLPLLDRLVHYLFMAQDARSFLQQRSASRMRTEFAIPMPRYVKENGYEGLQAVALLKLAAYVNTGRVEARFAAIEAVQDLIAAEYPDG